VSDLVKTNSSIISTESPDVILTLNNPVQIKKLCKFMTGVTQKVIVFHDEGDLTFMNETTETKKAWNCLFYDTLSPSNTKRVFITATPMNILTHEHIERNFFYEIETTQTYKGYEQIIKKPISSKTSDIDDAILEQLEMKTGGAMLYLVEHTKENHIKELNRIYNKFSVEHPQLTCHTFNGSGVMIRSSNQDMIDFMRMRFGGDNKFGCETIGSNEIYTFIPTPIQLNELRNAQSDVFKFDEKIDNKKNKTSIITHMPQVIIDIYRKYGKDKFVEQLDNNSWKFKSIIIVRFR
jgi:hypothetical protein